VGNEANPLRTVDVIGRISDHPSNRLEELLPDHWKLAQLKPVAESA
jgi:hypothetical protein